MSDGVIGDYVSKIEPDLPLGRRMRTRIKEEITDYLHEAIDAGIAEGLSAADAKQHAIERFGRPHVVARAFAESRGVKAMATTFTRWAGLMSIVGAVLIAASLGSQFVLGFHQIWADGLGGGGVLALLIAVTGMHFRQRGTYGGLGRIGFRLLFLGFGLMGVALPFWNGLLFFSGELILVAGLISVGIASWRAAILPRVPLALIPLGIAVLFLGGSFDENTAIAGQAADLLAYLGIVSIAVAFGWIGIALWSETPTDPSESPIVAT